MPDQRNPIAYATVQADSTAARVPFPQSVSSGKRVFLSVYEAAGPVTLVGGESETVGLSVPAVAPTDENFALGIYTIHAELYLYASAPTSVTLVFVVLAE